jgi:signal transduction histidine kinase
MKFALSISFLSKLYPKPAKTPFWVLTTGLLAVLAGTSQRQSISTDLIPVGVAWAVQAMADFVTTTSAWAFNQPPLAGASLASLVQGNHWAELSVMVLLVLLARSSYQHQQMRQKQMDTIRNQIAADLHDEIGSSLSSIGLLGALARNGLSDPLKAACLLNQLVEETRQVSNALDDVVWSVSPRDEQSAYLGARMYRYAANLFENAGITYRIDIPDEGLLTRVPIDQQRDLYFFFKEVVNNIIKHAGATSASITLSPQKAGLQLTITDNGRGFDPSLGTLRNGLRNLNLRTTALRGRLSIQSAVKQGTTIGLWFPLPSR